MCRARRLEGLPLQPIELRRVDPARDMRRFYRLDIEPDLFGGFLLLKQWGRIGTDGCKIAHRYNTEALAICDGRLRLRPGAGSSQRQRRA